MNCSTATPRRVERRHGDAAERAQDDGREAHFASVLYIYTSEPPEDFGKNAPREREHERESNLTSSARGALRRQTRPGATPSPLFFSRGTFNCPPRARATTTSRRAHVIHAAVPIS